MKNLFFIHSLFFFFFFNCRHRNEDLPGSGEGPWYFQEVGRHCPLFGHHQREQRDWS